MENLIKKYFALDNKQKEKVLQYYYHDKGLSWIEIAKLIGTYPMKVRREAQKFNITSRTKSQAQSMALEQGRSEHRTKGKKRSKKVKEKISEGVGQAWDSLDSDKRRYRSHIGKKSWDQKSDEEKQHFLQKGQAAVRLTSKIGSKLEHFLLRQLTQDFLHVRFHQEQMLRNIKLHIDIFLPTLKTAIEVDGPSHFKPVWGEENLKKNILSDMEKTGLILSEGYCLIRVKQKQTITFRYMKKTYEKLFTILSSIEKEFPLPDKRYFEL